MSSINIHALKFRIQSNPGNYIAALVEQQAPRAEKYVGVTENIFFYDCPYKSASCPRVPTVRIFWRGSRAPPAQWRRRLCLLTYLLTYLVGARAQVHFSRRRHSRSRRYNSTIQDCFFIASYTVMVYSIQHCPAFSCPVISCPALSPPGILMVHHLQILHFHSIGSELRGCSSIRLRLQWRRHT